MLQVLDSLKTFIGGYMGLGDTVAQQLQFSSTALDGMYKNSWLPRKIVDIPAFDAVRKWRDWQAESDSIELIEEEEKRLDLQRKLLKAMKLARLHGGAVLYLGTVDGDVSQPLDYNNLPKGGLLYVTPLSKNKVSPGELITDPASEFYGRPSYFEFTGQSATNRPRFHPSRFVFLEGAANLDEQWGGDSVLTACLQAIFNADKTAANVAQLAFEAKVDVFRIKDLMKSLSDPEYERRLLSRLGLANMAKGAQGTLIMDQNEEYEQKTASFAQLPDLVSTFYQIVAGAADIPATRLMGMSPAGMNATGESDLRNYYDRIQAYQTVELTPALRVLDELLIRSATGQRDEEIHYVWSSLWQMSDTEKMAIGKVIAETAVQLNNTGLWKQEALAQAVTNTLIEHSILPGLQEAIDDNGGPPDFEAEAEAEMQHEVDKVKAITEAKGGNVVPMARAGARDGDLPVSDDPTGAGEA